MLWLGKARQLWCVAIRQCQARVPREWLPSSKLEALLTVAQAAKLLGITAAAIYKAIRRDRLPYIKLGRMFIQRADLIRYSESKSLGGRPKRGDKTEKKIEYYRQFL